MITASCCAFKGEVCNYCATSGTPQCYKDFALSFACLIRINSLPVILFLRYLCKRPAFSDSVQKEPMQFLLLKQETGSTTHKHH